MTNNAVFEVVTEPSAGAGPQTTSRQRLVLRVHRPRYRTPPHIRSELHFLQTLAEDLKGTPIDVPCPIAARNGDLLVQVPHRPGDAETETRSCDLLTWIDGDVLKPGRGLGPRSSFLLGEALARLHEAAQRLGCPPGFELPRWDAQTMFSSSSPFQPGSMEEFLPADGCALFQQVAERTHSAFQQLDRQPESWTIIHADFILVNCHFSWRADGWKVGILDFDDLGWGYWLYDLAPLLGNLADFPDSYARLRRAFLAGYRSRRPLPVALGAHLPILMAARHAVSLTWLAGMHRRGETEVPIEQHTQYRLAAIRHCLGLR